MGTSNNDFVHCVCIRVSVCARLCVHVCMSVYMYLWCVCVCVMETGHMDRCGKRLHFFIF